MAATANSMSSNQANLLSQEALRNPHPIYALLRKEAPIFRIPSVSSHRDTWIVTRYDDCIKVLKDYDHFANDVRRTPAMDWTGADTTRAAVSSINRHLLTTDPPDHIRLRELVHRAFTPKMINELAPRIQTVVDDLLAGV